MTDTAVSPAAHPALTAFHDRLERRARWRLYLWTQRDVAYAARRVPWHQLEDVWSDGEIVLRSQRRADSIRRRLDVLAERVRRLQEIGEEATA
ncbi:MAG: hypothetical protein ACODAJ_05595 [Planctomycetota bacterium]